MGTQLSKCQIEQVNKLTEAVTKLTDFLHDDNRLAARSISDTENSNNSGSGDDDEKNDTRTRFTIHEMDRSLYKETGLVASFLFHQKTSSSSAATTGKPEDDPMGSVFKQFSESCT